MAGTAAGPSVPVRRNYLLFATGQFDCDFEKIRCSEKQPVRLQAIEAQGPAAPHRAATGKKFAVNSAVIEIAKQFQRGAASGPNGLELLHFTV